MFYISIANYKCANMHASLHGTFLKYSIMIWLKLCLPTFLLAYIYIIRIKTHADNHLGWPISMCIRFREHNLYDDVLHVLGYHHKKLIHA